MKTIQCDILIIGSGCAGMTAALRAHEAGIKNIVILEKAAILGGNSRVAGCMFSTDGDEQLKQGFLVETEPFLKQTLAEQQYAANTELVKKYVRNTGKAADWLVSQGIPLMYTKRGGGSVFEADPEINPYAAEAISDHSYLGQAIVVRLAELCKKAGVEIYKSTPAMELIRNESGAVVGALARSKGEELRVEARATVLTTGGAAGSMKSLARYFPQYFKDGDRRFTLGVSSCTGDGIVMAENVGAETRRYMNIMLKGPCHLGPGGTQALVVNPRTLYVDIYGRRFTNEAAKGGSLDAMQRQTGKRAYAIAGADLVEEMNGKLPPQAQPGTRGEAVNLLTGLLQEAESGKYTAIVDTVAKAAAFIGAEPSVLEDTITRYNELCFKKEDVDFFKDPEHMVPLTAPYYVLSVCCSTDSTQGGIKIDPNFRVLKEDDTVINGLYAIGDNAGGFVSFRAYGPTGAGFTWSLNSGHMAGHEIAQYLLKQ